MGAPLILCYHAVSPDWPADLASTPEQLDAHCRRLLDLGYRAVTLDGATEAGGRVVALTFDDAYRSVLALAKPILDELDFVATVFVPTSYIPGGAPMAWPGIDHWVGTEHEPELVPMSWDELGGLRDAGWQIGSHTHTHPHLTELTDERLAEELGESRRLCSEALGEPCETIAYPYGDHDERVVAATRSAGYRTAVTLPVGLGESDPLRLPRVGVYRADDPRRFRIKTAGPLLAARRTALWPRAMAAIR